MSGASPNAARYVAGIAIFLAISVAAAVISRILHLGMRILPGVTTLNRVAGAVLSIVAFTLALTLVVSLVTFVELPDVAAEQLDESTVVTALTEPEGLPQRILGFLSGDRVMEITLRIRELTGSEEAVALPDNPLQFPAASTDELERLTTAEDVAFDLLNRERVAADADSLSRSTGLDNEVAFDLAMEGYVAGYVPFLSDSELRTRLNNEGMPSTTATALVVLAASPEAAHAALADKRGEALGAQSFTRCGIAVVQGPVGLLVVEVLAG
jgi:hypothetical protein